MKMLSIQFHFYYIFVLSLLQSAEKDVHLKIRDSHSSAFQLRLYELAAVRNKLIRRYLFLITLDSFFIASAIKIIK
jgi:hypothetical protein